MIITYKKFMNSKLAKWLKPAQISDSVFLQKEANAGLYQKDFEFYCCLLKSSNLANAPLFSNCELAETRFSIRLVV